MTSHRKTRTTLKRLAHARGNWRTTWRQRKAGKAALRKRMMAKLSAFNAGLTDAACLKVLGKVLPYKRKASPYLGPYAQSTTDQQGRKRKRKARGKAMIQAKNANGSRPEKFVRGREGVGVRPARGTHRSNPVAANGAPDFPKNRSEHGRTEYTPT